MRLNILQDEGVFIPSTDRASSPFRLPPFFFGDAPTVELCMYKRSLQNRAFFKVVDLEPYDISLELGQPNQRPTLGFWTLTTAEGTTPHIASRASVSVVKEAMASAFGEVTVTGGEGSYIITLRDAGVWALPTAEFQGATLSDVLVFQLSPGTATTPAQYRVEVLEVAPARIPSTDWTEGDTEVVNTVAGAGLMWEFSLDSEVTAGFFTLTADGETTTVLSFSAGASDISNALGVIGKHAQVQRINDGGFFIAFRESVTAFTVDNVNLIADPFQVGTLGLSSTGIREMLDGLKWVDAELTVKITQDNTVVTVASAPVIIKMPTNQPAVVSIDTPSNSGITVNVSEDGSYLLVIRDGQTLGEIPLIV